MGLGRWQRDGNGTSVNGEAGVVDGGHNAIEVAHLAAAEIFDLELARATTINVFRASPTV